jgi:hypothetical protein
MTVVEQNLASTSAQVRAKVGRSVRLAWMRESTTSLIETSTDSIAGEATG